MATPRIPQNWAALGAHAALGAALGALAVWTLQPRPEGAGLEHACVSTTAALRDELTQLRATAFATAATACPDLGKRMAHLEYLRAAVADTRAANARFKAQVEEAQRKADANPTPVQPLKFPPATLPGPKNVPARYAPDALEAAVQTAFNNAGLVVTLQTVGCGRIPCVVEGRIEQAGDIQAQLAAVAQDPAFAPYVDDAPSWSGLVLARGSAPGFFKQSLTLTLVPKELAPALAEARAHDPPNTEKTERMAITTMSFGSAAEGDE